MGEARDSFELQTAMRLALRMASYTSDVDDFEVRAYQMVTVRNSKSLNAILYSRRFIPTYQAVLV